MMTSYFSKYRGENGVSIARKTPKGFKGVIYTPLFPPSGALYDYKSGNLTKEAVENIYIEEVLEKLDPYKIIKDLGENAVLLCYEKSEDFCHRHIVAKWIYDKTGIIIPEYDYKFCINQDCNNVCSLTGQSCNYFKTNCSNCINYKKESNEQLSLFDFL